VRRRNGVELEVRLQRLDVAVAPDVEVHDEAAGRPGTQPGVLSLGIHRLPIGLDMLERQHPELCRGAHQERAGREGDPALVFLVDPHGRLHQVDRQRVELSLDDLAVARELEGERIVGLEVRRPQVERAWTAGIARGAGGPTHGTADIDLRGIRLIVEGFHRQRACDRVDEPLSAPELAVGCGHAPGRGRAHVLVECLAAGVKEVAGEGLFLKEAGAVAVRVGDGLSRADSRQHRGHGGLECARRVAVGVQMRRTCVLLLAGSDAASGDSFELLRRGVLGVDDPARGNPHAPAVEALSLVHARKIDGRRDFVEGIADATDRDVGARRLAGLEGRGGLAAPYHGGAAAERRVVRMPCELEGVEGDGRGCGLFISGARDTDGAHLLDIDSLRAEVRERESHGVAKPSAAAAMDQAVVVELGQRYIARALAVRGSLGALRLECHLHGNGLRACTPVSPHPEAHRRIRGQIPLAKVPLHPVARRCIRPRQTKSVSVRVARELSEHALRPAVMAYADVVELKRAERLGGHELIVARILRVLNRGSLDERTLMTRIAAGVRTSFPPHGIHAQAAVGLRPPRPARMRPA
jgi:hypothetical protein